MKNNGERALMNPEKMGNESLRVVYGDDSVINALYFVVFASLLLCQAH